MNCFQNLNEFAYAILLYIFIKISIDGEKIQYQSIKKMDQISNAYHNISLV